MTDVVQKLWGFCHALRHDGIGYTEYVEQLTYLLFLKMADERGIALPSSCDWQHLRGLSGTDLLAGYTDRLRTLGKQTGLLGSILSVPGRIRLLLSAPQKCILPYTWAEGFQPGCSCDAVRP